MSSEPAPRIFSEPVAGVTSPDGFVDSESTPQVDQLGTRATEANASDTIAQRQIPQSAVAAKPEDRLTVDQLRAFRDRCRAGQPSPPGLDCSGIRLRVERLFRSDDEVARALTVLDRLGTQEEPVRDTQARLFVQRAIAEGALLPEPPPPPQDPNELLPENSGLIDAIISTTGSGG